MEERQRQALSVNKHELNVVDLKVSELHDFENFCEILGELNIPVDSSDTQLIDSHRKLSATRFNKTTRRELKTSFDFEFAEQEVWEKITESSPGLRDWLDGRYGH